MIIPTTKSNPTRFVEHPVLEAGGELAGLAIGFMEHFDMSREDAEKKTQLYIDLGYFRPSDEAVAV